MHRIDHATKNTDEHGAGLHGFTEGDPAGGIPPTVVTDDWLDDVQESLCRAVEESGEALVKGDGTQLATAIRVMAERQADLLAINNWTARENDGAVTENLYGVASAIGSSEMAATTLLVGANGTVQSSTDRGFTWNAEATAGPITDDLFAVVWGEADSRWVIAGETGKIQTASLAGSSWTARTAAGGYVGTFRAAAYDGAKYCLVGTLGAIQTSADGITWAAQTPAAAFAGIFYGVTYGAGVWVAVGAGGVIQSSVDGVTWVSRTSGTAEDLRDVEYADGRFVAVGGDGKVCYSTNGTAWTLADVGTSGTLKTVQRLGHAWVVRGATGTLMWVAIDHDLDTWTERYLPGSSTSTEGGGIASNGVNLVYVENTGRIFTSQLIAHL